MKESRGGRGSAPGGAPSEHERAPVARGSAPRAGHVERPVRVIERVAAPPPAPTEAPATREVASSEPPSGEPPEVTLSPVDVATLDRIAAGAFPGVSISLEEELAKPWAKVWIVRLAAPSEPSPVGFLVAWHVVDELHVLHVATDPEHRRAGHGEALLREVLEHASRARVRMILLEVRRSNRPAIKLYRKLGFCALGIRPRYYSDGEDAVELMRQLDPETGQLVVGRDEVLLLGAGLDGRA